MEYVDANEAMMLEGDQAKEETVCPPIHCTSFYTRPRVLFKAHLEKLTHQGVCDGSLKPTPTPTPGPSGLTLPKIIDF
jgi:hypothetical protein